VIEGDLIKSAGDTILGGDDKAGVSVILEIVRRLKEEKIAHGDLLIVITVAEEAGIKGAGALDPKYLKAISATHWIARGPRAESLSHRRRTIKSRRGSRAARRTRESSRKKESAPS